MNLGETGGLLKVKTTRRLATVITNKSINLLEYVVKSSGVKLVIQSVSVLTKHHASSFCSQQPMGSFVNNV